MRLAIFGLTVSSSWGNGHATIWRGLIRALADRGHHVTFFEHDLPYYAQSRDLHELPGGGVLVLFDRWEDVRARAARVLDETDVAIVTSYCPDALAATALVLDSRAELKVFYDMDAPITIERARRGETVEYIGPEGLGGFDLVLSFAGGPALDELRARFGARFVQALHGSIDPCIHRPVEPRRMFEGNLSYLGTFAANRQEMLQRLFLDTARRRPDRKLTLGGSQYPADFPWAPNVFYFPHVAPVDHPAFYCSSTLTLNVTRRPMAEMGHCPSGRIFEAAACGVPVLSDPWNGLETFFTPGEEILVARSTEEAVAALELPRAQLERIGRAARERVLSEHTGAHRAAHLEHLLESARNGTRMARA